MHPTRGAQVRKQKSDKSDLLAHPARWCERNRDDHSELEELFNFNNLSHDVDRSRCVTSWSFGQGERSRVHTYLRKGDYPVLDGSWLAASTASL